MSKFKIETTRYTVTNEDGQELEMSLIAGNDCGLMQIEIEGNEIWFDKEQAKQVAELIVKLADVIGCD